MIVLVALLTTVATAVTLPYSAVSGQASFQHRVRLVTVNGTIENVSGTLRLDPSDLAVTTGSIMVPIDNLKTGIALRDTHAKSEVALHTSKYPTVTFVLEKLIGGKLVAGKELSTTATGKLTVKGVTKTLSVPVKALLEENRVNVSTQFKFNPHDFGVDYPGSSGSVTVDVKFTLAPSGS